MGGGGGGGGGQSFNGNGGFNGSFTSPPSTNLNSSYDQQMQNIAMEERRIQEMKAHAQNAEAQRRFEESEMRRKMQEYEEMKRREELMMRARMEAEEKARREAMMRAEQERRMREEQEKRMREEQIRQLALRAEQERQQEAMRQMQIRKEAEERARQEAMIRAERERKLREEQMRLESIRREQERQERERQEKERYLEAQRLEAQRLAELRRQEEARLEQIRQEQIRMEQIRQEQIRQEKIRMEQIRQEQMRQEQIRQQKMEQERQEQIRQEQIRQVQIEQERKEKLEKLRQEQLRQEQIRQEQIRQEQIRQEQVRQEQIRQEEARQEQIRQEQIRQEQMRQEQIRQDQIRQEEFRQEQIRQEQIRQEQARQEQERMQKMQQLEMLKQAKVAEENRQRAAAEEQQRLLAAQAAQAEEERRRENEAQRLRLLEEAKEEEKQRIEFEENQRIIAENAARLEAEQAALADPDAAVLARQASMTAEQGAEIQKFVAAVVGGEELAAEQQMMLRHYLTSAQLEEVKRQMLANLESATTSRGDDGDDEMSRLLREAAEKSAQLEREMKEHEEQTKRALIESSKKEFLNQPPSPCGSAQKGGASQPSFEPSFPDSFEMDNSSSSKASLGIKPGGQEADPFDALPAPRKSRGGAGAGKGGSAKVAAAAPTVAVSPPSSTGWNAKFDSSSASTLSTLPSAPKAPLSSGISAEERKLQIEREVRKKIEDETRAKIAAEKKKIEDDVRRKIESERSQGSIAAARPAVNTNANANEMEVPAPKKLGVPVKDQSTVVAPPAPVRAAPPPPQAAANGVVDGPPMQRVYRNPFDDVPPAVPILVSDNASGASVVSMAGWLNKKGAIMKSYKQRWMVLRGAELQWYESERQPTPQGSLTLQQGEHTVVDTPGDVKFEVHPKDPKERAYFFKADSPQEKKRWMVALKEVLLDSSTSAALNVYSPDKPALPMEEPSSPTFTETPPPPARTAPPVPVSNVETAAPVHIASPPILTHMLTEENRQLASTLSSLSGLGLGDDDEDEDEEGGGEEEEGGHVEDYAGYDGYEQHDQQQQYDSPNIGHSDFVSNVELAPPSAAEQKHSKDLATIDWYENRVMTPERGFARSAYEQDRARMGSVDWASATSDERDTWRLLILNTMLMEKEQLASDLAVLRTLWMPAFGGGVKKSKIKTFVKDPLFVQLDEQLQELFDRHRNLVVQLAQQRNSYFESRSFGEMVLKLANYAAKIDIGFLEACASYVAAFQYHARTNAKFAKFLEKQKTNPDLVGCTGNGGFVELLRAVVDHLDRFNIMYQDLLQCTDPAHPDFGPTQKALFVVLAVTELIAEIDARAMQHALVAEVEPQLEPVQKGFYTHERRLLKRSKCSYFVKDKKRMVQKTCDALLFSDLLIIGEETTGQGKSAGQSKLQVLVYMDLETIANVRATKEEITQSCKDLEQTQIEMSTLGLLLANKKKGQELFYLNTVDEKEDWKLELTMLLQRIKTDALHKKVQK